MFVKVFPLICFYFFGNITIVKTSKFRILAPEFICPKDNSTPVGTLQNTIITIQSAADSDLYFSWEVRWIPLKTATQRTILLLWRTVRQLETQLNKLQLEPNVYSIEHDELLEGVNYVFNVTAYNRKGEMDSFKSFQLDNSHGNKKLEMVDGRGDLISVVLVGSETVVADVDFIVEAQITTCHRTQDYYFVWNIDGSNQDFKLNTSNVFGSRLVLPPYSLQPGFDFYDVSCQVIKRSNGFLFAKTGLPICVAKSGLEVYLSADYMMVSINNPFNIKSTVINHDSKDDEITYNWSCSFEYNQNCNFVDNYHGKALDFVKGIPELGNCFVELSVSSKDQRTSANITITTLLPNLPTIQIEPISRILLEGSMISLSANASNVAPQCTLTWFFIKEEFLSSNSSNETCENCQHGVALSEALTIYSLEENFLTELSDFTNSTEWRQVTVTMTAATGRARFLAECGCSASFDCDTQGSVYADVFFKVNGSPKLGDIMISPDSGVAMETVFRISTVAAEDLDVPLRYNFMCRVGVNETLLLGSYLDHLAVETFLPYIVGGTEVWVEVCDRQGACSISAVATVKIVQGDGRTDDILLEDSKAYISRCDFFMLRRTAVSAIVTYENLKKYLALRKFSDELTTELEANSCKCTLEHIFDEFKIWINEKKK